MTSGSRYDTLVQQLRRYGQEHVLRFWQELDEEGRSRLASQLEELDWPFLQQLIDNLVLHYQPPPLPSDIRPAPYIPLIPESDEQERMCTQARKRGVELLSNGRVAGFTVAGGQGTRLGYDGPKGTFPIAPVSGKSLFQLFAEGILRAREKYGAPIPWYIMTSPPVDAATRRFFDEHDYFGLPRSDVFFLVQGTFPAVGLDGRLLLGAKDSLALSPNGHGGSLEAMRRSGASADMQRRGIEHISYWQVDNPLVYMFDPLFIGLHDLTASEMSSRCLIKSGPFEKLGNFCIGDGRLCIIEYSEFNEVLKDLAVQKDEQGRLRFRAGSPAIHILRRDFVERLEAENVRLPVHRALKKVRFVDEKGEVVEPRKENGIKFEMFIFDALIYARNPLVLEADRQEQFAPVKNRTGVDSVETCRRALSERAARWLEAAGVPTPRRADGTLDCVLELSPRRFLDADDVKEAASDLTPPRPGERRMYE